MSAIDVEALLSEISSEAPCGENLEYDLAFGEMERASQGKAEQQFGDTVIAAVEPDWRELKRLALELSKRTKDLRVLVKLAHAVLNTDGLAVFCDCLAVLRGCIDRYWDSVHPQLDPDDDNDPTLRVNTLASLGDADTTLRMLRKVPLVSSLRVGRFSLVDIEAARGEVEPPEDSEPPSLSMIEAAFTDCELEPLQSLAATVRRGIEDVRELETALTAQVGVANAASFAPLVDELRKIERILSDQLSRRGVGEDGVGHRAEEGDVAEVGGAGSNGSTAGPAARRLAGEVTSREDVILALDKICAYYERYEPSSPLPLLLHRAKRLATKSFLEIIRDLTPDGFGQAKAIGGISEDAEEGAGGY